jgi:hypothetical protein
MGDGERERMRYLSGLLMDHDKEESSDLSRGEVDDGSGETELGINFGDNNHLSDKLQVRNIEERRWRTHMSRGG